MAWNLVSGIKDTPDKVFPIKAIPAKGAGCINWHITLCYHCDTDCDIGEICQKDLTWAGKRECNTHCDIGF